MQVWGTPALSSLLRLGSFDYLLCTVCDPNSKVYRHRMLDYQPMCSKYGALRQARSVSFTKVTFSELLPSERVSSRNTQ